MELYQIMVGSMFLSALEVMTEQEGDMRIQGFHNQNEPEDSTGLDLEDIVGINFSAEPSSLSIDEDMIVDIYKILSSRFGTDSIRVYRMEPSLYFADARTSFLESAIKATSNFVAENDLEYDKDLIIEVSEEFVEDMMPELADRIFLSYGLSDPEKEVGAKEVDS